MKRNIIVLILLLITAIISGFWHGFSFDSLQNFDFNQGNSILLISAIIALLVYFTVIFVQCLLTKKPFEQWLRFSLLFIVTLVVFFLRGSNISLALVLESYTDYVDGLLLSCLGIDTAQGWFCSYLVDYIKFLPFISGVLLALVITLLLNLLKNQFNWGSNLSTRFVLAIQYFVLLSTFELFARKYFSETSLIFISSINYASSLLIVLTSNPEEEKGTKKETDKKEPPTIEDKKNEQKEEKKDNKSKTKKGSDTNDAYWSVG